MKLTAGEVFNAVAAIRDLGKERLPVKGAYWLNRVLHKLNPEYLAIDVQRNDLIKKHGEEKDGKLQVLNGNLTLFMAEFGEVLAQEIEVDCPTIRLELLGDGEIPAALLVPLDKFIDAAKEI